jgi:SAM-dependent methyltransferase
MTDSAGFHDFEHRGWESVAGEYNRRFAALTSQSIPALLHAVRAGPGVRLLDVACGPGYAAAAARQAGCEVLGIDFASRMVELARAAQPEIEFREGDAENLPFPDASFGAVVMNFGMLHLGQPDRAIREAARVLRQGGRYAFTVWDVPERATGFHIVLDAIQTYGRSDVPLPEGPPFFRFSDPQECRRTLSGFGFTNVKVQTVPQVWRLDSGVELFEAFLMAAVRTAALLHGQTPEALDLIRAEIVNRAEAYRREGRIELSMPAVLTSGQMPSG